MWTVARIRKSLPPVLVTVAIGLFLKLPFEALSNAVMGWIDDQIADVFHIRSPSVGQVLSFAWNYVLPFGLAALAMCLYHQHRHRFEASGSQRIPEKSDASEVTEAASDRFSLDEAARQICATLVGTQFGDELELLAPSNGGIVHLVATQLYRHGLLWGRRWTSDIDEAISGGNYWLSSDNKTLNLSGSADVIYKDLFVKQSGINEFIRFAKNGNAAADRNTTRGPLHIEIGEAGAFSTWHRQGLKSVQRTLNIKLENTALDQALSECKLQLVNIDPYEETGPWIIAQEMVLAAGDHKFVPLVTFGEPGVYGPSGDTFMLIRAHGSKRGPMPSSKVPHVLTLRATAIGSAFCEIKCKLWVDTEGHLRLEKIS